MRLKNASYDALHLLNQRLWLLPWKVNVSPSEVAIRGGLSVNRPPQIKTPDDAIRAEVEVLLNNFQNLRIWNLASSKGINKHRQRLRQTNSISNLNKDTLGKAGGNDALGNPPSSIAGAPVDL